MYKRNLLICMCALLIGAMGGVFISSKSRTGAHSHTAAQSVTTSKIQSDAQVTITKGGLQPDTLVLRVGQTLHINAQDGKKHSFSLGHGGSEHSHTGSFSSGDFSDSEAWSVTFKKAGTYQFHDHYNPKLNLLVVAY